MILNENILADYFQDNMVFPRNKKFSIWGYVRPKSTVKVNFQNQDFVIQADSTGFLKKYFLPIDYLMRRSLIVKNDQRIQKINNLKLGKVYLLSGQSNY